MNPRESLAVVALRTWLSARAAKERIGLYDSKELGLRKNHRVVKGPAIMRESLCWGYFGIVRGTRLPDAC
jgi:hypothetical protein